MASFISFDPGSDIKAKVDFGSPQGVYPWSFALYCICQCFLLGYKRCSNVHFYNKCHPDELQTCSILIQYIMNKMFIYLLLMMIVLLFVPSGIKLI